MNTSASGSDRATQDTSFIGLVLIPTVSALSPWLIAAVPDSVANGVLAWPWVVASCLPLIGVASVVSHGLRTSTLRALWPMLPFVAAASCFLATGIVIVANFDDYNVLEGTTHWFGDMQFANLLCLATMPFFAAIGGATCLRARRRAV